MKHYLLYAVALFITLHINAQGWGETQKIVTSDREGGDVFGWDVAISGNYIVAGAYGEDIPNTGDSQSGAAYIFEKDVNETWNEIQKIVASDAAHGDQFGQSVAIDGNHIIVGAPFKNYTEESMTSPGVGRAYVYENNGSNNWGLIRKASASDRAASDSFGYSVAISGDYAMVGAYQEDEDASGLNFLQEAGSVYILDASEPSLSVSQVDFRNEIYVYPNPVNDKLTIDLKQSFANVQVSIINLLGQQVFEQNYSTIQTIELPFNFEKEMYVIELKSNDEITSVFKIIKQ